MIKPVRDFAGGKVRLYIGDSIEVMRAMKPNSISAIVTDPPYGLEFMGKDWDTFRKGKPDANDTGIVWDKRDAKALMAEGKEGTAAFVRSSKSLSNYVAGIPFFLWSLDWTTEAFRILKPGGHLASFGGTRTFYWLAVALEIAGFECRDTLSWLYGTGFPKSMDISKAIDKQAGAQREVIGKHERDNLRKNGAGFRNLPNLEDVSRGEIAITAPATDAAKEWSGWGTALKPGWEPALLFRKPVEKTVIANVQEHGTGALNIDASRIAVDGGSPAAQRRKGKASGRPGEYGDGHAMVSRVTPERYATPRAGEETGRWPANVLFDEEAAAMLGAQQRFFYTAKASNAQREGKNTQLGASKHPTVKPVDLMRWLIVLLTPPNGVVLDPFAGSCSTLEAAVEAATAVAGIRAVGIDKSPESAEDFDRRFAGRLPI